MDKEVMTKPLPTSLRLDPKLKERLQKLADAEHRSLTNLIEKILMEYCDGQERRRKV
jgi:predicted transcriptional regulator